MATRSGCRRAPASSPSAESRSTTTLPPMPSGWWGARCRRTSRYARQPAARRASLEVCALVARVSIGVRPVGVRGLRRVRVSEMFIHIIAVCLLISSPWEGAIGDRAMTLWLLLVSFVFGQSFTLQPNIESRYDRLQHIKNNFRLSTKVSQRRPQ